jgi:AcrR family transcriptional regulator
VQAACIFHANTMTVNGDPRHNRRTQAERSATTRAALLAAARDLFAARGYAGTAREEIVAAAGVTRGALHHHFGGKADLFRAVYEDLEREVLERVAVAAMDAPDPLAQLRVGAIAYLDIALDPAVQRVMLIDAPAVLDWEVRRQITEVYGLGLVREVLRHAMEAGQIAEQPPEPLAHILLAALHEAVLLLARAEDPGAARAEIGAVVDHLLASL